MLRVGCLFEDTPIIKAVVDYIYSSIVEGDSKTVKIDKMYSNIRKDGVEIDFESFAVAYNIARNLIDPNGEFMNTEDQLKEKAAKEINDIIEKLEADPETKTIGRLSPEKQILAQILKLFDSTIKDDAGKTIMRKLQDAVKAKALSLLDKEGVNQMLIEKGLRDAPEKLTLKDILNEISSVQSIAFTKEDGSFNNVQTLVQTVKETIEGIKDRIPEESLAEFEVFTDAITSGLSSLIVSNSQTQQIIKEALIRNGFSKEVGGKQVVDWNKATESVQMITDGAGVSSFEEVEHNFDSLYDAIVGSLVKEGMNQALAQDIANSLRENIESKIAEAKAKSLKLPKPAVQKLLKFAQNAKENEGKEGDISILMGNYLVELNRLLNIDPDVHTKVTPQAVSDLIGFMNELNDILPNDDPQKAAIQIMSPTVENLFKRRLTKILMDNELTPDLLDKTGRYLEGLMVSKGLLLSNPYNILQNISGGFFQTMSSGAFFGPNMNWGEFFANLKSVGTGDVENIGKTNAGKEEIDLTNSMTMLAEYKGKNPYFRLAKVAKAISDFFLNSFDAAWGATTMNHYSLTLIHDIAYRKMRKADATKTNAEIEDEVNELLSSYMDGEKVGGVRTGEGVRKTTYVKNTLAQAQELIEQGLSQNTSKDDIEANIIQVMGDKSTVRSAIQVGWIMKAMGMDPVKKPAMARRLFYEVSRGTLINDLDLTDKAGIISRVSNEMALTLAGKKTNSEAILSTHPKMIESASGWVKDIVQKARDEGNYNAGHMILDYGMRQLMLFAAGAARWNVIALNYLPSSILIQSYLKNKKGDREALFTRANSEAYKQRVADLLEGEGSEASLANSVASFHKQRQIVLSSIIASTFSLIALAMMFGFDDDDEFKKSVINESPGFGKQASKIIQQFPAVYAGALIDKYGFVIGSTRAFIDIYKSRFPDSNEKNRDLIEKMDKAKKTSIMDDLEMGSRYEGTAMVSDFFTLPYPEFVRTWKDYLNGIGFPVEKSPRRAKPDDYFEAWFNRGIFRTLFELAGADAFEHSPEQRKQIKNTEKWLKKHNK